MVNHQSSIGMGIDLYFCSVIFMPLEKYSLHSTYLRPVKEKLSEIIEEGLANRIKDLGKFRDV